MMHKDYSNVQLINYAAMMSQPVSFTCRIQISELQEDAAIPGKYNFTGTIVEAEPAAINNSFYAHRRKISGFTFEPIQHLKEGSTIEAEVAFMGNPFVQNYELKSINPS